jgi:RimJ/RimL family protein N-acetyltransferase
MIHEMTLRPVEALADAPLLQSWLAHPKSAFWLMGDLDVEGVTRYFLAVAADPAQDAYIGMHAGAPVFLMERYRPAHSELAQVYPVADGDVGMHFLVAPSDAPVHGFTRAVITRIMRFLFEDPATARVVVEPDARNTAVHALNAHVGFVEDGIVDLPEKKALLSFCTRAGFAGRADA